MCVFFFTLVPCQINTGKEGLTVEAEPRKLGLNRQGEGELNTEELEALFPAER